MKVSRFFTIPVHELFGYFIDPNLLERWCYPEGMNLKTVHFDDRPNGKYHYEHTSAQGTYICNGHIRKIVRNELLRTVDDEILGPKGEVLETNLTCDLKFTAFASGSGVEIIQAGFRTAEGAKDCEKGWTECLQHLQDLVKDSGIRQFSEGNFDQGLVQT